jgi:hypothetical protein
MRLWQCGRTTLAPPRQQIAQCSKLLRKIVRFDSGIVGACLSA